MAKKDIEVNTDVLKSVHGSATAELYEAMGAQLSKMLEEVEGLNSVWEGPNHDEFAKLFESQKLELDGFNNALAAFLRAWKKAYDAYSTCESEVSQRVG